MQWFFKIINWLIIKHCQDSLKQTCMYHLTLWNSGTLLKIGDYFLNIASNWLIVTLIQFTYGGNGTRYYLLRDRRSLYKAFMKAKMLFSIKRKIWTTKLSFSSLSVGKSVCLSGTYWAVTIPYISSFTIYFAQQDSFCEESKIHMQGVNSTYTI